MQVHDLIFYIKISYIPVSARNKASEPEPTPTSVTKGDKDGIELSNKEVSNGDSKGHLNQAFHVERF